MISVENVHSILRLVEIGDLKDRWGTGSEGDGDLDGIRGSVDEGGRRCFLQTERSGWEISSSGEVEEGVSSLGSPAGATCGPGTKTP